MKPLICIRHQETCPLGILSGVFDEEGVEWRYLDAWRDEDVPELSDISGLVVLGGEMNVDEVDDHPYLKTVRDVTRAAVEAEMPVMGICLGSQTIARALGAVVAPAPVREIGFVRVHATKPGLHDPVLAPFAPGTRVFQFHEDASELPKGAELLFRGYDVPVQAFRIGERAYGVQFHFEVTTDVISRWCDDTPDLEEKWGATKSELLDEARDLLGAQQVIGRAVTRNFCALLRSA